MPYDYTDQASKEQTQKNFIYTGTQNDSLF